MLSLNRIVVNNSKKLKERLNPSMDLNCTSSLKADFFRCCFEADYGVSS